MRNIISKLGSQIDDKSLSPCMAWLGGPSGNGDSGQRNLP